MTDRVYYKPKRPGRSLSKEIHVSHAGVGIAGDLAGVFGSRFAVFSRSRDGSRLYITPAEAQTPGSLRMTTYKSGALRIHSDAMVRQLGLCKTGDGRRCPAEIVEGEIVVDLLRAEKRTRAARKPKTAICGDCGRRVPVGKDGRLAAHDDPDGILCPPEGPA